MTKVWLHTAHHCLTTAANQGNRTYRVSRVREWQFFSKNLVKGASSIKKMEEISDNTTEIQVHAHV